MYDEIPTVICKMSSIIIKEPLINLSLKDVREKMAPHYRKLSTICTPSCLQAIDDLEN